VNPFARRRYRRWCARSADHLGRFHDAIAVVGETTPDNLVGVGDQVIAATRELRAYLAEDPCPEPTLAGVLLSAFAALGTIRILFGPSSTPRRWMLWPGFTVSKVRWRPRPLSRPYSLTDYSLQCGCRQRRRRQRRMRRLPT
jgi:hypothetical protein